MVSSISVTPVPPSRLMLPPASMVMVAARDNGATNAIMRSTRRAAIYISICMDAHVEATRSGANVSPSRGLLQRSAQVKGALE